MNLSLPLFDVDDAPPAVQPGQAQPAPAPPAGAGQPSGRLGGARAETETAETETGGPAAAAAERHDHTPPGLDQALHPAVWRASQLGGGSQPVSASGFVLLDAELPGGGWPHGVLTELLLPQPGIGELRLLAPALDTGRCVMLFDPPAALSAWALAQCGLDSRHWLVVRSRPAGQARAGAVGGTAPAALSWQPDVAPGVPRGASRLAPLLPGADVLWALEQALKSGQVGAVLAWLPVNLRADALRRLQLAAQAQAGPVFLFRDALARGRPSPAPLRLLLQPAGVDGLAVRILKRRGPQLAQPLRLPLPPVLPQALQAQLQAQAQARLIGQALAGGGALGAAADMAGHAAGLAPQR